MKHINEVNIHTWRLDVDDDHIPEEAFLPTVTEDDVGKVLMVSSDGIWETKEFSGGSATQPYVEEVYDSERNLIEARLVGYTFVRDNAFNGCKNLALTSLPSGLTSIGYSAFRNCTSLTSITFEGTLTTINSHAFDGCTNLTTINVPWAEGEVANAPWGTTNATINYNYVP